MRFSCACLLLVGCGFPNVTLDASPDATVDSTMADALEDTGVVSDGGADVIPDSPPLVTSGCKSTADCTMSCFGKLGSCGCAAYLVDSAAPFCDTLCATGCATKKAVCIDSGMCILQ